MDILKTIALSISIMIFHNGYTQNLIQNGSFELNSDCNNTFANNAIHWKSIGTADYFNSCFPSSNNGIPLNVIGYQWAKTGNAYVGVTARYANSTANLNFREFIQIMLDTKLVKNSNYCVSFYISIADSVQYGVNKFGLLISDSSVYSKDTNTFGFFYMQAPFYIPQVEELSSFISDPFVWKEISGIYNASGNEKYLTIGNFKNDSLTDTIFIHQASNYFKMSYYYIDDVSVEEVKNVDAGLDKSICISDSVTLGNNPTENAQYQWYPQSGLSNVQSANPKASPLQTTTYVVSKTQCKITTTDSVTVYVKNNCTAGTYSIPSVLYQHDLFFINGLEPNTQVELYTLLGQKIISIEDYRNSISTANLAQGTYIYKVSKPNGEIVTGKVMVVK